MFWWWATLRWLEIVEENMLPVHLCERCGIALQSDLWGDYCRRCDFSGLAPSELVALEPLRRKVRHGDLAGDSASEEDTGGWERWLWEVSQRLA